MTRCEFNVVLQTAYKSPEGTVTAPCTALCMAKRLTAWNASAFHFTQIPRHNSCPSLKLKRETQARE